MLTVDGLNLIASIETRKALQSLFLLPIFSLFGSFTYWLLMKNFSYYYWLPKRRFRLRMFIRELDSTSRLSFSGNDHGTEENTTYFCLSKLLSIASRK